MKIKALNKRAKVAAAPQDAGPAPAENTFAGMPLDIILQFLLFMSPAELLAMHDVNKWFRGKLHGKKATALWVKSRQLHDIPEPFDGFDELAWARFIFGRVCQECGTNEAREPDFGLMMRLCAKCRDDELCQELDFSVESDEEDFAGPVLEFEDTFPHSQWYSSREEIFEADYRLSRNQYWWAPYCFDILPLVRAARRGSAAAQKKLDKLEKQGERRLAHGVVCDEWRNRVEAAEHRAKLEALTAKFKALGYLDPDLADLRADDRKMLARFNLPLTEDAWVMMRTSLESAIKDKRRDRLVKDYPDIIQARKVLAREAYVAYASAVLPKEAPSLPSLEGLEVIPEIRAICEREPDVEVNITDFDSLPSIVAERVSAKRAKLTQLANSIAPETTPDRFSLASTIFRCKDEHGKLGRPAMFGGDEAMRHIGEACDPQLDVPLSKMASDLVALLGLGPDTASVADMDLRDARFRCDGKAEYNRACDDKNTITVLTWRGCITHAINGHSYGQKHHSYIYTAKADPNYYHTKGSPQFSVVSASVAEQARGSFKDDQEVPAAESPSWMCGHCTKYVCGPETRQGVAAHLNDVHGKSRLEASDILIAPGVLSISNGSYLLKLPSKKASPNSTFRCLKCDSKKKFKGVGPVTDHLKGVHQILGAVFDSDYATF